VIVPLNLDAFTYLLASNASHPGYTRLFGKLDAGGRAEIPFAFEAFDPRMKGTTVHMAAAILGTRGFDAATRAIAFTIH
jgi:hypothetical protein